MKIEGRNAVLELLKTEQEIDKICIEKDPQGSLKLIYSQARQKNIKVQFLERAALDKESSTSHHQGVIAYTSDFKYADIEEFADKEFIVICDGIEDVHNLGSIIRVCECAGVDGVIIPSSKSAQVNENVVRISAGAANHMKVAKVGSLNYAIEYLQNNGYWVYALEANGESIYESDVSGKIALVIGGEDSGVRRIIKEKCDKVLSLPLYGKVNSLNASIALGIAVYECRRRR